MRARVDEWHIWSNTPIRVLDSSTVPHCAATLWYPYLRPFRARLLIILCNFYFCSVFR